MNFFIYFKEVKKTFQDNTLKKIIQNSSIVFSGNLAATVLNLISFAVMARQLGPEYLAILILAQTYAIVINDIFNIQTWESMIKFGSEGLENGSIKNVIKTNFVLDFLSAIIACTFALLIIKPAMPIFNWDVSYMKIFFLYSFSILFNITTFTIGVPRLFDKFLSIAKIMVLVAIIKLVAIIYAMFYANLLIVYVYINLGANIFGNVALIMYSFRLLQKRFGYQWWKEKFEINKDQIKFIWWTNLRTIIRIPVQHLDMIVISAVISIKMVGVYKIYKEVVGLIGRFGEPVNQVIFPEYTKLLGNNELKETATVTKKMMLLLTGAGLVICISLLIASRFFVQIVFGEAYLLDINALYIMIVLFTVSFITVPINSLFIAAGFARYSFFIILISNIFYLLTAYGLGRIIGIYGIVLAYAVQLIINKGLKIIYLNKYSSDWGRAIR